MKLNKKQQHAFVTEQSKTYNNKSCIEKLIPMTIFGGDLQKE